MSNSPEKGLFLAAIKKIEHQIPNKFELERKNFKPFSAYLERLNNDITFSRVEKLLWQEKMEPIYKNLIQYVSGHLKALF